MSASLSMDIPVERVDRELHQATRSFARQSPATSWWHVGSTFGLLACVLAVAAVAPWWPVRLAASTLAALLLVRAFILYHDFMHGAILPGSTAARAIFYAYAAVIFFRRARGATATTSIMRTSAASPARMSERSRS